MFQGLNRKRKLGYHWGRLSGSAHMNERMRIQQHDVVRCRRNNSINRRAVIQTVTRQFYLRIPQCQISKYLSGSRY